MNLSEKAYKLINELKGHLWMPSVIFSEVFGWPEDFSNDNGLDLLVDLETPEGDRKSSIVLDRIQSPREFWSSQIAGNDILILPPDKSWWHWGGSFQGIVLMLESSDSTVNKMAIDFGVADFIVPLNFLSSKFRNCEIQSIQEWVPWAAEDLHENLNEKALYLDRDNVIVPDVPYNSDPSKVSLSPGIVELLAKAQVNSWNSIMVSNQSGVGRGKFSKEDFMKVHREMLRQLATHSAHLEDAYWAFHHESSDDFNIYKYAFHRKPRAGMFWLAGRKNHINQAQSLMVGDKAGDLIAAYWAGVSGLVLLETAHVAQELSVLNDFQKLFIDLKYTRAATLSEVTSLL